MNANKSEKTSQPVAPAAKVTEHTKAQPKDAAKPESKEAKPVSSVLSQREAVYQEISRVLHEDKIAFDGATSVKPHITEERLKRVYDGLVQGFVGKKIALKENESNQKKLADVALLRVYCSGLVNNWLRRDGRLNGRGVKKS